MHCICKLRLCEISDSHGGENVDVRLLGCDAA
jgi:hypothetical protein